MQQSMKARADPAFSVVALRRVVAVESIGLAPEVAATLRGGESGRLRIDQRSPAPA
jgi:hypothetical protein